MTVAVTSLVAVIDETATTWGDTGAEVRGLRSME
jgi:hypothetical protein